MKRRAKKAAKPDKFYAPTDSAGRAELIAAKRTKWPHPLGTVVSFRKDPGCVTVTESVAFFRASDGVIAVYVSKSPTCSKRCMVAVSQIKKVSP